MRGRTNPKNPFLQCAISEVRARGLANSKITLLRIPRHVYESLIIENLD